MGGTGGGVTVVQGPLALGGRGRTGGRRGRLRGILEDQAYAAAEDLDLQARERRAIAVVDLQHQGAAGGHLFEAQRHPLGLQLGVDVAVVHRVFFAGRGDGFGGGAGAQAV